MARFEKGAYYHVHKNWKELQEAERKRQAERDAMMARLAARDAAYAAAFGNGHGRVRKDDLHIRPGFTPCDAAPASSHIGEHLAEMERRAEASGKAVV